MVYLIRTLKIAKIIFCIMFITGFDVEVVEREMVWEMVVFALLIVFGEMVDVRDLCGRFLGRWTLVK